MDFPAHKASMHLVHNDHLSYYSTVENAVLQEDHGYAEDCWISEEQKQKAIATNECWYIQWYPETPVGFCCKSAADLALLLAFVKEQ